MRILLVNTYDLRGGAARAIWRLFDALKVAGHEATMLVQEKRSKDPNIFIAASPGSRFLNPFRPYLDFMIPLFQTRQRVLFSTPSGWLAQRVTESPLLGNRKVVVIPNGLDTSTFRASGKEAARQRLNLPTGKKIILFGAIRATENPLKGFALLVQALKMLNRRDHQLVVFGSSSAGKTDISGLDVRFSGQVNSHKILIDLYSAADVVAVPSMQEVFGQSATEAMACGTPVVAFACTGLLDIVIHQETGYLAEPFNVEDLSHGIEWVLANEQRRLQLGGTARAIAVERFDSTVVADKMIRIYQEAIDANKL